MYSLKAMLRKLWGHLVNRDVKKSSFVLDSMPDANLRNNGQGASSKVGEDADGGAADRSLEGKALGRLENKTPNEPRRVWGEGVARYNVCAVETELQYLAKT